MITECPHCYRKVLTRSDGTCPSCGGDPESTKGADTTKCQMTFSSGLALPEFCIFCATPSRSFRKFRERRKSPHANQQEDAVLGFFEWVLGSLFTKLMAADSQSILIDIPVCADHEKTPLPLKHVDFDNYQASFVVDKKFRELVKATRE